MNSFSTFSKAIARTNIETKSPYIVDLDEDYSLLMRINIGLVFDKIINYSSFLINFSKNISKRISTIRHGLKDELISDFQKFQIMNSILYELIKKAFENIDSNEENIANYANNEDQLIKLKSNIFDSVKEQKESFQKIEENIKIISKKETYIDKYIHEINHEIKDNIIRQYQLIKKIVINYEMLKSKTCEDLEVSNSEEKILNLLFLQSALIDDLTLKFHCFSVDSFFKEIINDDPKIVNQIFDTLNEVSEKNFRLSYNNPIKILNEITDIRINFDDIIKIISNIYEESEITDNGIQKLEGEKYQNLIDISTSISIVNHIINEIEVRSTYYELNKIICSLSSIYYNKESFIESISTAIKLITAFSQKIDILTESEITKQNLSSAFNSILYYLKEKCTDLDSSLFGLISTVRIIAQIFPDSEISEILLTNLYNAVSKIIKSFATKCKEYINQFMTLIYDNLEYFENSDLNDSNYYFTALNGIDENELIIDSDHFISLLQQFFDYFCSSYRSFNQMVLHCQNDEVKSLFELSISEYLKLGILFSKWMNQFYLIICSIAHLRSKLILDSFSFPIFLLEPSIYYSNFNNEDSSDDEYDSENEEEESEYEEDIQIKEDKNLIRLLCTNISNIQKILDKTPQFLLCDINDTNKLINSITNISNNFNKFIKYLLNLSDSPFYPIFNSAIVSISEILSRKMPNCLLNLISLANFNDSDYFYCSINASARYSLLILKENQELIQKEKIISPFIISPSFSLILSAINISDYPTNKINAKKITSNLSSIYKNFQSLWLESMSNEEQKNDNFLNSLMDELENLLIRINQLNRPSIPYKIPKTIIELKQYNQTISLIHNKSVKEFAKFLIQTLFQRRKININQNSHNFLNSWFDNVLNLLIKFNQNQNNKYKEIEIQFTVLENLLKKLNKWNTDCYSSYIRHLTEASIFIAYKEDEFENKKISDLHKKIISLSSNYFTFKFEIKNYEVPFNELFQSNKQILEIYDCFCQIYFHMKNFNSSEDEYLNSSYKNVIQIINFVLKQKKLKEMKINLPFCIKSLNELNSFEKVQNESISEFIDYIINNNHNYNRKYYRLCKNIKENETKNDYSNETKILFSCISNYIKLFPIQSSFLEVNEPIKVKNKILKFSNSIMNYLKTRKNILEMNKVKIIEKKKEMNDFLCDSYQSINFILIYFIHFLRPIDSNSHSNKELIQLISNFSEIQVLFIKMISFISKINSSQSNLFNKATKKLQKIVVKLNEVDNIIFQSNEIEEIEEDKEKENHVEKEESCHDKDDVENKTKSDLIYSKLFSVLIEIIFNVSKLNEIASYSFVSEMYECDSIKSMRNQSIENLNNRKTELKEELNQIESNSHHHGFNRSYESIDSSIKKFIDTTNKLEFDQNSDYFKKLIQSTTDKNKKIEKIKLDENESDENKLFDSNFSKSFRLSPLLSPQYNIFRTIFSITTKLMKEEEEEQSESEKKSKSKLSSSSSSLINYRSNFPSPPNLLKSYFLAADVDPYIGFRSDEENLNSKNSSYEEIRKRITENEFFNNNNLYEKHIRRYRVAMRQANDSFVNLNKALTKFNEVASDKKSTNDEIVIEAENLKEATDDYAEKVLQITYFTKKSKALQVEQLIELHKYVDSVNELQEAVKQRLDKGDQMIQKVNIAISNHDKIVESTADQFKRYNEDYFCKKDGVTDDINEELENVIDQEIKILTKLDEFHNQIELMLKDVNIIIKEDSPSNDEFKKSIGPIMLSITNILKRAKNLTRNRIIKAKREELKRNPVIIDKKGNITRRTSINEIDIKLENEEGLIKAAQDLQEASKLMLVSFEIQDQSVSNYEYKIISSLHSVKKAITVLITQIMFIGGDPDKIMNKEVNELTELIDSITKKVEKICYEKISTDFIQKKEKIFKNSKEDDVSKRILPILHSSSFDYENKVLKADLETKIQELEKFKRENK